MDTRILQVKITGNAPKVNIAICTEPPRMAKAEYAAKPVIDLGEVDPVETTKRIIRAEAEKHGFGIDENTWEII